MRVSPHTVLYAAGTLGVTLMVFDIGSAMHRWPPVTPALHSWLLALTVIGVVYGLVAAYIDRLFSFARRIERLRRPAPPTSPPPPTPSQRLDPGR
ncbi:MAG TPA: hypothetical protein VK453_24525 [Micromonosporaceae bacterium]|nr:hypothetical protein [Micromonosporaceae bacterium]